MLWNLGKLEYVMKSWKINLFDDWTPMGEGGVKLKDIQLT
jgi:hypothetical protein